MEASKPGVYTKTVLLNLSSGAVAVSPGKKVKRVPMQRHVDAVAIVCDVLWTLTIIGVAAPISDGLLGTFTKVDSPVNVELEPDDPEEANPMPVYAHFGTNVPATVNLPAPSAPAGTPSPPAGPQPQAPAATK